MEDTPVATGGEAMGRGDARRAVIHAAAIEQFSKRGFTGTSMANIAEAAGLSRPALYQYFRDKDHIFAAAFVAMFENRVANALAALDEPGTTADRLDGFLQRFEGDLWEDMAATPHADEFITVKKRAVTAALEQVIDELWQGMAAYLKQVRPGRGAQRVALREDWLTVLRLSPKGFRSDGPEVDAYRRRLTALARTVASEIDNA